MMAHLDTKPMTLQIPAGEALLTGDLEIPEHALGLVLFAHGSGSSRTSRRNRAVAEILRKAGIGTLLFDLLTPAEEVEDSFSAHLRFDIGLLSRRLAIVTTEVAGLAECRSLPLGYFGASTGAAAALVAARRRVPARWSASASRRTGRRPSSSPRRPRSRRRAAPRLRA